MGNYINRNKIIQAIIVEPCEHDKDIPFSSDHGWQIKLIISFQEGGYPNYLCIDYKSEDECKEAIKKLKLTEI